MFFREPNFQFCYVFPMSEVTIQPKLPSSSNFLLFLFQGINQLNFVFVLKLVQRSLPQSSFFTIQTCFKLGKKTTKKHKTYISRHLYIPFNVGNNNFSKGSFFASTSSSMSSRPFESKLKVRNIGKPYVFLDVVSLADPRSSPPHDNWPEAKVFLPSSSSSLSVNMSILDRFWQIMAKTLKSHTNTEKRDDFAWNWNTASTTTLDIFV